MGDPLGIGPEVLIKALLYCKKSQSACYGIIGCESVFSKISGWNEIKRRADVFFIPIPQAKKTKNQKRWAGSMAMSALQMAVETIRRDLSISLVTAPISKEHIKIAGFNFPGHTEYLCDQFSVKKFAMMLFNDQLRVVLATIHVPLKDVAALITKKLIYEKLQLTCEALNRRFQIKNPRIAVCGLNPHAGESGLIGSEEKKVITPAVLQFQKKYRDAIVSGPHPADSLFHQAINNKYDAVLCLYHDQGLIALKTHDFYHGVNMTLGLPFVRTSPDHGTAFDIAYKNKANPKSMIAAILAANKI